MIRVALTQAERADVAQLVARRRSPSVGCPSKCPGGGAGDRPWETQTSLYCELEAEHDGEHKAGLLHWASE